MTDPVTLKNVPIRNWAQNDRPREKLLQKGRTSLSEAELLAILISSGTATASAVELGKQILCLTNNNLNELGRLTISDLKKIKGIGQAKAIAIIAALELGRRRKEQHAMEKQLVRSSRDIFEYFDPMVGDLPYEEFWIMLLNRASKIIGTKRISGGGVNSTIVDAKLIFKYAVEELASSVVLCHNHPSGNIRPSEEDIRITNRLRDAGKLLDIGVPDHVIIGEKRYYSFSDEGLLA